MKNILLVDIDTDRVPPIKICKPPDVPVPASHAEMAPVLIQDMMCLCEAICTLIHVAEQAGYKSSPDSLRDCIRHLEDGFAEAGYVGRLEAGKKEDVHEG